MSLFSQLYTKANGTLAKVFYGNPAKEFFIIAITGTKGKSTTGKILHHILNNCVGKTLLIDTHNIIIGEETITRDKKQSTQAILAEARAKWCQVAIIVASDQQLRNDTFQNIECDMAVLTNVIIDDIDNYKAADDYAMLHKKLFQQVLSNTKNNKLAVMPKDDRYGNRRYEEMSFDKGINFGITSSAALQATDLDITHINSSCKLVYLGKEQDAAFPLTGEHNIYNLLSAMSACLLIGLDLSIILESIQQLNTEQFQTLQWKKYNNISVYTDKTESPIAMQKTIAFCRSTNQQGKVISIIGSNENQAQRQQLQIGKVADTRSHVCIITDNYSNKDKENTLYNIKQGISRAEGDNCFIIPERKFAIQFARSIAESGDQIVIFSSKTPKHEKQDKDMIEKIMTTTE